jgi:hypothetical protein
MNLLNAKNWSSVYSRKLRKAVENEMFPHFLAASQWISLVTSLALNMNFSVAVTGAVANGGLKIIMLFHIWMLFSAVVLCLIFYRLRKGIAERCIIGLSMITILFSVVNVPLHFVNDFVLLMKTTEVVAWSVYNTMFSVSIYKISIVFLLPVLRRFVYTQEKETPRDDEKLWA